MEIFKFESESDQKWYIVLPEWEGDKAELEMVCGADTMLEILGQGEPEVHMSLSQRYFEEHTFTLKYIREDAGGGWYYYQSEFNNMDIWLCSVTKYVFGELPEILYGL